MAQKTIGWGIIGSSGWAERRFAPAILLAENAELRAVLSSDIDKARRFCHRWRLLQ